MVGLDGQPITDPARADKGMLLPMGGHKGAGLDFMAGVLAGVLNGATFGREVVADSREPARASNTGQALLVLRPDLFMPRDQFLAEMDRQLATFRASRSATDQPVRYRGRGLPPPPKNVAETRSPYQRSSSPTCAPLRKS